MEFDTLCLMSIQLHKMILNLISFFVQVQSFFSYNMISLASGLKECFQKSLARQHRRSHCKVEIGCYWWCWDAMTGIFYNLMSQLHQEAASYLGDFESNHYHQNFDRYKKLYIANQRHQKWTHSVSNADKSWGGFSLKFLRLPPWKSNDLRWCQCFFCLPTTSSMSSTYTHTLSFQCQRSKFWW